MPEKKLILAVMDNQDITPKVRIDTGLAGEVVKNQTTGLREIVIPFASHDNLVDCLKILVQMAERARDEWRT